MDFALVEVELEAVQRGLRDAALNEGAFRVKIDELRALRRPSAIARERRRAAEFVARAATS